MSAAVSTAVEIRVPDELLEEDGEAVLASWLYGHGERVAAGAVIAQLMVEKVQVDLVAPAGGVLQLEVPEEAPLRRGQLLARLTDPSE